MDFERAYPTLPLLTHCNYCVGYRTYSYENRNERVTKPCKYCKGKGLMVLGAEALKYELTQSNRRLHDLIKAYKKESPIPKDYNQGERCYSCNGSGRFYIKVSENKETITNCRKCQGYGHIYKSEKQIFKEMSSDISSLKRGISIFSTYLKEKAYEAPEYKEYSTYKVSKHYWVCIKCDNYGKEDHLCYGCGNHNHGLTESSDFAPVNDKAKEWYNSSGYKYNLGYNPNHDYTIK